MKKKKLELISTTDFTFGVAVGDTIYLGVGYYPNGKPKPKQKAIVTKKYMGYFNCNIYGTMDIPKNIPIWLLVG